MKRRTAKELDWLPIRNDSGEVIPTHSCVQITDADESEADGFYAATKPDGSGSQYAITGPKPIAIDGFGVATRDYGVVAAYNTGDGTPAHGQTWGPESGQWALQKDASGFKIVGDVQSGTVRVMIPGGGGSPTKIFAFENTGGTIGVGATGTGNIYPVEGCSEGATQEVTLCNYETGSPCWPTCKGQAHLNDAGEYVIIKHNGATMIAGTSAADSNNETGYSSPAISSPVGIDGHFGGVGTTFFENATSKLEIRSGDAVVLRLDDPSGSPSWKALSAPHGYPGCNLAYEDGEGKPHKFRVDIDSLAPANETNGIGYSTADLCPTLFVGAYGCLEQQHDGIGFWMDDVAGAGLTASGCAIDVNVGCGLWIYDDQVQVYADDLAGYGLYHDGQGEDCKLNVDAEDIVQQIVNNYLNVIINAIKGDPEFKPTAVEVLTACKEIDYDSGTITFTYETKSIMVLGAPVDGSDDTTCTWNTAASCS